VKLIKTTTQTSGVAVETADREGLVIHRLPDRDYSSEIKSFIIDRTTVRSKV
jgi:hypothetical protein